MSNFVVTCKCEFTISCCV